MLAILMTTNFHRSRNNKQMLLAKNKKADTLWAQNYILKTGAKFVSFVLSGY
jgi:hypothetical protein